MQRLQRSAQGWLLARELLGRPDEKVKFIGALTIIVKLNTERQDPPSLSLPVPPCPRPSILNAKGHSANLSHGEAAELLQNLLQWFLKSLDEGTPLVPRKLCAALVTFFIHFPHLWTRCIRHLLVCLCVGGACELDSASSVADPEAILQPLGPRQLQGALWFSAALVEEVGKMDMNSAKQYIIFSRLESTS